jgi:hypothetical protein
MFFFAVVLAL